VNTMPATKREEIRRILSPRAFDRCALVMYSLAMLTNYLHQHRKAAMVCGMA
jgi:hypothetical protein